jgi:hypothetical protein
LGDIPEYKERGRIKGERETANYGLDIIRRAMYTVVYKNKKEEQWLQRSLQFPKQEKIS